MMSTKIVYILVVTLFISSVDSAPKKAANHTGKYHIKVSDTEPAKWLTNAQIDSLLANKTHFMDITGRHFPKKGKTIGSKASSIPTEIRFEPIVTNVLKGVSIMKMKAFVKAFSSFLNRFYTSEHGEKAANWLYSQVDKILKDNKKNYRGKTRVAKFTHKDWPQPSIIAKIFGSDTTLNDEVIILGAHLDSINGRNQTKGKAPGANDNASGSVTLLETLRLILESGKVLKRTVEFQWYAAEERGLLGSGEIAEAYYNKKVKVVGMINFDIVGYAIGEKQIGFLDDSTDLDFTQFLKKIVQQYCTYSVVDNTCGYGCSDHATFYEFNFRTAAPSEFPLNDNMHTLKDTIKQVDFEQIVEFVKLAVAASIEIAEPMES